MPELMKSGFIWIFMWLKCIILQPLSIMCILWNLLVPEFMLYRFPPLGILGISLLT